MQHVARQLVRDPARAAAETLQILDVHLGQSACQHWIRMLCRSPALALVASVAAVRPISSNSPAPNTWEWLVAICSTSVVPDRGMPTMKTGSSLRAPPCAAANRLGVSLFDKQVNFLTKQIAIEANALGVHHLVAKCIGRHVTGECFIMAISVVEQPAQCKACHNPRAVAAVRCFQDCREPLDFACLVATPACCDQMVISLDAARIECLNAPGAAVGFVEAAEGPQDAAESDPCLDAVRFQLGCAKEALFGGWRPMSLHQCRGAGAMTGGIVGI